MNIFLQGEDSVFSIPRLVIVEKIFKFSVQVESFFSIAGKWVKGKQHYFLENPCTYTSRVDVYLLAANN